MAIERGTWTDMTDEEPAYRRDAQKRWPSAPALTYLTDTKSHAARERRRRRGTVVTVSCPDENEVESSGLLNHSRVKTDFIHLGAQWTHSKDSLGLP